MTPEVVRRGGRVGLTLAELRALCPGVEVIDHDPRGDLRSRMALAWHMTRFTPLVSLGWPRQKDEPEPLIEPPVLFLDLTGCERLFGGIEKILELVRTQLRGFDLPAQMAVAPTPGAAWALAWTASLGLKVEYVRKPDVYKSSDQKIPAREIGSSEFVRKNAAENQLDGTRTRWRDTRDKIGVPSAKIPAKEIGQSVLRGKVEQKKAHQKAALLPETQETPGVKRWRDLSDAQHTRIAGGKGVCFIERPNPLAKPQVKRDGSRTGVCYERPAFDLQPQSRQAAAPPPAPQEDGCVDIVGKQQVQSAVASLPVAALRLEPEVVEALVDLGLTTIGQLLRLPRKMLPSRFGKTLALRLAQILGQQLEPLVALAYVTPVEARVDWQGSEGGGTSSLEILLEVLRELVGRVVIDLRRRGHGAREMELSLTPGDRHRAMIVKSLALSRPTRTPRRLLELLKCAAEKIEGSEWIEGFVGVCLKVTRHEPVKEEQLGLHQGDEAADANEVDGLIDRLRVHLGEGAVIRPARTESRLPERAWRALAVGEAFPGPGTCSVPAVRDRPTCVLQAPLEIRVVVEPSDFWEGRPAQFSHASEKYSLVSVRGPERIGCEWWRGHEKTRDYYDVTDERGRRWWIFRVASIVEKQVNIRWFLHGMYQ